MVILLCTRGTAGSDIWFTRLADKPMVRSYHLRDYQFSSYASHLFVPCKHAPSASSAVLCRHLTADRYSFAYISYLSVRWQHRYCVTVGPLPVCRHRTADDVTAACCRTVNSAG